MEVLPLMVRAASGRERRRDLGSLQGLLMTAKDWRRSFEARPSDDRSCRQRTLTYAISRVGSNAS